MSKVLGLINEDSKNLVKKRQNLEEMLKLFKYGELSCEVSAQESKKSSLFLKTAPTNTLLQEISALYLKEIKGNYEQLMKNVNSVIISRKALFSYSRNEGVELEKNLSFFEKAAENPCFGCNVNLLANLLRFFSRNNNEIAEDLVFLENHGLLETLRRNMSDNTLFAEIRNKSRKAIVQLLGNNLKSEQFFEKISAKLQNSQHNDVALIIEILRNFKEKIFMNQVNQFSQKKLVEGQEHLVAIYKKGVNRILSFLPQVLETAKIDAIVANKCLLQVLVFVQKELSYSDLKEIIKKLMKTREGEPKTANIAITEEGGKDKKKEKLKVFINF